MTVVRWQLEEVETDEVVTLELNPNEMASYTFPREFEFAKNDDSRMRAVKARRAPLSWSFGGVVRTQAHHDLLVEWQQKPGKVRVTDHLGRTFEVMMSSLDMRDRRATLANSWRFTYTFNCLLLRRIA